MGNTCRIALASTWNDFIPSIQMVDVHENSWFFLDHHVTFLFGDGLISLRWAYPMFKLVILKS